MHSSRLGQFLSVSLVVLGISAPAFGQWVDFDNETGSRLSVAANLGVSDGEEKDYGVADFDGDGDEDLIIMRKTPFTSDGPRVNVLLMNEGGVLTDRTTEFATASDVPGDNGFNTPTNDRDIGIGDFDGDGWLDFVTVVTLADGDAKHLSHPRVYMNLGAPGGTWLGFEYQDARIPMLGGINPSTGMPHAPRFCSVAVADIDDDGDIDLYFGDYDSGGGQTLDFNDRLLVNDGNGYFTDETTSRFVGNIIVGGGSFPFQQSAFGTSVEFADMNMDGNIDLVKDTALNPPQYVGVSYGNGAGSFTNHDSLNESAPYFTEVGDLNNDGMLDFIVTDDGADHYHLNLSTPGVTTANFNSLFFSTIGGDDGFGGNNMIVDLNKDGWNDVIITDVDIDIAGCARQMHIYRNLGNAPNVSLTEFSDTLPFSPTGVHDVALIDINGDTWTDMVIGRCSGTQVWINQPPIGLVFTYPQGIPGSLGCGDEMNFTVEVTGFGGAVPAPGLEFFLSINGGPFASQPVADLGGDLYEMNLPAGSLADRYEFYVSAETDTGVARTDPSAGAGSPYAMFVADTLNVTMDDLEGSVSEWIVETGTGLTAGAWEHAEPIGTSSGGQPAAPSEDGTQGSDATFAFVTQNGVPGGAAGAADVDGAFNRLISPMFDMAGTDGTVSFKAWFVNAEGTVSQQDEMVIDISNNDGATWTNMLVLSETAGWESFTFQVSQVTIPTDQMRVRWVCEDNPNNSITEGGVDNFAITLFECDAASGPAFTRGDVNADGGFDVGDPVYLLDYTFSSGPALPCEDSGDANDDGSLNIADAVALLDALFGGGSSVPAAPFPGCGEDPTDTDSLGCASFPCP